MILAAALSATTPFPLPNATLALQPQTFGEGPTAVAKMAQPTGEPVEDYEYVSHLLPFPRLHLLRARQRTD